MPRFTSKEFSTTYDPTDNPIGIVATGGTKIIDAIYAFHVYTSSNTFVINKTANVDYLVVAGGGGGGGTVVPSVGGGGGGGGLLTGTITVYPGTYNITVGAGGAIGAGNGTGSSFSSLITTIGGGGGGAQGANGNTGGSGGGGGDGPAYLAGTTGAIGTAGPPRQGYDGGGGLWHNISFAGGGGGAGGNARSDMTLEGTLWSQSWGGWAIGGPAHTSTIFKKWGDPAYLGNYASGGTGYNDNGQGEVFFPKVPGGGGNRASPTGSMNTGGGAGGAGAGGSGIVLLRYRR